MKKYKKKGNLNLKVKSEIFKNLCFIIITHGIEVTTIRKELIKEVIISNSGVVFEIDMFHKEDLSNGDENIFIVTSTNITLSRIYELNKKYSINLLKYIFLSTLYISDCIKYKKIIDNCDYRFFPIDENSQSQNHIHSQGQSQSQSNNHNQEKIIHYFNNEESILTNHNLNQNKKKTNARSNSIQKEVKFNSFSQEQEKTQHSSKLSNEDLVNKLNILKEINNKNNTIQDKPIYRFSNTDNDSDLNKKFIDFINDIKSKKSTSSLYNSQADSHRNSSSNKSELISSSFNTSSMSLSQESIKSKISNNNYLYLRKSNTPNSISIISNTSKVLNKPNPNNFTFTQGLEQQKKEHQYQSSEKEKVMDKNQFLIKKPNEESEEIDYKEIIINELEKMLDYHINENNTFESFAYRKTISIIKKLTYKIVTYEDIKKLKNIGKNIKKRIKEIIHTGNLKENDYIQNENNRIKNEILKSFCLIHGVGTNTANRLYNSNIRSISQLRNQQDLLTSIQRTGLLYYEDLIIKIPRSECEAGLSIIKNSLFLIISDEVTSIDMCGSFRRGKELCGDIDILITRTDDGNIEGILEVLIEDLYKKKFIIETLSINKFLSNSHTFLGICMIEKIHRRVDIKVYNKKSYPFALLYFTGSAYFNRSMRLYAKKLGLNLTDSELKFNENITKYDSFLLNKIENIKNEEDIFKALDVEYILPKYRDI